MAGHSKWANIQHRKSRQDEKRGRIWTKLIREITIAAQEGADVNFNPKLRLAITKARASNMPADTIKRAVQKGSGQLTGIHYEDILYEGYGLEGAALLIACMTDKRTRTVAEIRHLLNKYGGQLGTEGSVAFQFRYCGRFILPPEYSEDQVLEAVLDEVEDILRGPDAELEIICAPQRFEAVQTALEKARLSSVLAEVTYRAEHEITLCGEPALAMQKLLDALEDLEDVQAVYSNAVFDLPV